MVSKIKYIRRLFFFFNVIIYVVYVNLKGGQTRYIARNSSITDALILIKGRCELEIYFMEY